VSECAKSIASDEKSKGIGYRYDRFVASELELEYGRVKGRDLRSKNQAIQDVHQSDSRN
jgi:hypothetical protein